MTTQQPQVQRRLRRRTDDRVIAGVASGLGDYFNVDPLLIRIGLVASLVFGGLGIFLYAAAWLLVPTDTDDRSNAERLLGRAAPIGGLFGAILVFIGAVVVLGILTDISTRSGAFAGLAFAVVVVAIGAMLLRRGGPDDAGTPPAPPSTGDGPAPDPAAPGATAEASATGAPAAEIARSAVRRASRPPSPLGWYVIGAGLIGSGLLALATNVSGVDVALGQYFGLALGVIGAGLLIGTWWGHARLLIVLGLVLLPVALAASLVDVPLEGGWGARRFSPTTADDVREEYRLLGGDLTIDLTNVDAASEPIAVAASVAMGELSVLLPDGAGVEIDATVGGGAMRILGAYEGGTRVSEREVIDGDGPQFVLDLDAGLGYIRVATPQTEGN